MLSEDMYNPEKYTRTELSVCKLVFNWYILNFLFLNNEFLVKPKYITTFIVDKHFWKNGRDSFLRQLYQYNIIVLHYLAEKNSNTSLMRICKFFLQCSFPKTSTQN